MNPARDPKQRKNMFTQRGIMEGESGRMNHGGRIREDKSGRRNHGGEIMDEESGRRNQEG